MNLVSAFMCLLLGPGALSTPAGSKLGLSSCFRDNVAYDLGQAIASKIAGDASSCQRWCQVRDSLQVTQPHVSCLVLQAVQPCSHWAYSRTTGMCYLRQGDKEVPMAGYVSGPKFCPRQPASDEAHSVCSAGLCLQVKLSHHSVRVSSDVRGDNFITRGMCWLREGPCVTTTGASGVRRWRVASWDTRGSRCDKRLIIRVINTLSGGDN